jgi:type IX secretion system PorP/SprF family membrane protein
LNRLRIILLLLCCAYISNAQDIHFSQFYAAPLTLNPASTGDFKGNWRINNIYRNQWNTIKPGYMSNALSFDMPVYLVGEKFGGGFNLITDKSGPGNLNVAKINLSIAWHRTINQHAFHIGYQAGYIIKSVDVDNLTFPDQFNWETGSFDTKLSSYDDRLNKNYSFVDMNLGFGWNRKFGSVTPKFGFALFHINKPVDSFYKNAARLNTRSVITLNVKWDLNEKIYLEPDILYMKQQAATDFVAGIRAGRKFEDNASTITGVFVGLHARNTFTTETDAAIITAGINLKNIDAGLSYDLNVSSLQTATKSQGAFEISLTYTAPSTRLVKIKIPCDRY